MVSLTGWVTVGENDAAPSLASVHWGDSHCFVAVGQSRLASSVDHLVA